MFNLYALKHHPEKHFDLILLCYSFQLISKEVKKKQKTVPLEYLTPKRLFDPVKDGVGFNNEYWDIS